MTSHSPEVMQMARECAEASRINGPLGLGPPNAVDAAALAIVQTSELAAKLAERMGANCNTTGRANCCETLGEDIGQDIRTFSHLPPIAAEKDDEH